jgi:hypothetical protein
VFRNLAQATWPQNCFQPSIRIARSAQTVKRLDLFAERETLGPLVTLTDDDLPAESPDGFL